MQKILNNITIIRKADNEYRTVDVIAAPVLQGSGADSEKVREGVVDRLRKDPTVVCVLESRQGGCDETFEHEGFVFSVSIREGRGFVMPSCQMRIHYNGELVYENTYEASEDADGLLEDTALDELTRDIRRILEDIDMECFEDFVDEASVNFQPGEPEPEVDDIYEVVNLLKANNYECERLSTIGYVNEPCLVVHENDLVMIGEKHFCGQFFVEMKRILSGKDGKDIREVLESAAEGTGVVPCQYKDGSWGFRLFLYDDLYASNFVKLFEDAVARLRQVIGRVEKSNGVYVEQVDVFKTFRALFTYEVIDGSLALSKLSI